MSIELKDILADSHQVEVLSETLANSGLQYEITQSLGQPSPRSLLKASDKIGVLVGIERRFPNSVCRMSDTAAKATDAYIEQVMKADKNDMVGVAITSVASNQTIVLKQVDSNAIMAEVFGIFIAPKKDFGASRLDDGIDYDRRSQALALEYFTEQMKTHEAWMNNDIYDIKVWPKNLDNQGCFAMAEAVYRNNESIISAVSKCIKTVKKQMANDKTLTTLALTVKKDLSRSHLSASDLLIKNMKAKYDINFMVVDEDWDEKNSKLTVSYLPSCLPSLQDMQAVDELKIYEGFQNCMDLIMAITRVGGRPYPLTKWQIAKQLWSAESCKDWNQDMLASLMETLIDHMENFKFIEQTQPNIPDVATALSLNCDSRNTN